MSDYTKSIIIILDFALGAIFGVLVGHIIALHQVIREERRRGK